jgi:hypothetical protein
MGSIAARPGGGGTSPLDEQAKFRLCLSAEQPDMPLDEGN